MNHCTEQSKSNNTCLKAHHKLNTAHTPPYHTSVDSIQVNNKKKNENKLPMLLNLTAIFSQLVSCFPSFLRHRIQV